MENLKLTGFTEIIDDNLSGGLDCFTVDSFNNVIYAVTKSNRLISIDQKSGNVENITSIDIESVEDSYSIHVELFIENELLNIYFDNGIILTYLFDSGEINCVGEIENGIAAVVSSPDQECISLITKKDKLILFTRSFEILVEKDLHANHSECIKKVDVGWGSKQTQFHGLEGKQAAKIESEPLEPPVPWDDKKRRIFWRGDGLYFVTSAIHPDKNYRVLRIWDNEGLLKHESEYVAGIEHPLTWRPEGNLITTSRFFQNKHEIVFFEKNGLKHGQFDLPIEPGTFIIRQLTWSTDSKVLLIHGYDCNKNQDIIFLYTMRNYHWYLKQCFKFNERLDLVAWDPSSQLVFYVVTPKGLIKKYSFSWVTDRYDDVVAVIDGHKVQFTPFKCVSIPPPMSAYSIIFDSPINEVIFYRSQIFGIYNCDGDIFIYKTSQEESNSDVKIEINVRNTALKPASIQTLHSFTNLKGLIYHTKVINANSIIGIRKTDDNKSELILACLSSKKVTQLASFDQEVWNLDYHETMDLVLWQQSDLSIKKFSLNDRVINNWIESHVKIVSSSLAEIDGELYLFGLTRDGTLYCNGKIFIKNNCSSMLIHQKKFLITTGNDNLLRCNSLDSRFVNEVLSTLTDPRDEPRNIERGSKLVTSIADDARVILQMPRGNLEPIHPRTLLLDLLKQLLNKKQFGDAFKIMRRHRINLNLLVDHDRKVFLNSVERVILEIGKDDVQNICLFLSELQSEQISQTMYKFAYLDDNKLYPNKLREICSSMRGMMMSMDPNRYLIPILVSYVKDDPPQIDQALKLVYSQEKVKTRDDALKYLFYLIDIENLYKEALGTYDFDIFLMVAEKSNKDPKEYHQYLNQLKAIDNVYYRQYRIDVDLKRFEKALININKLTDESYCEECLNFIKNNRLFWSAVKIIKPDHPWIKSIWEMFGDYLLIKRYYEEAGVAYQKAKVISNAIKAYQLSENWQTAIELAISLPDYDVSSLCRSFVSRLKSNQNHLDASYIEQIYLNDKPAAILTLIEGRYWLEANRLLGTETNGPLYCTLQATLFSEANQFISSLKEKREDLAVKIERLKILEEAKIKALENENEQGDEENDLISDTSSVSDSSLSSIITMSSKSGGENSLATRKTRHKSKKFLRRYSLKQGSANEDIALRRIIKEIMESCVLLAEEAAPLIRWLYFYDEIGLATECQTGLSQLLQYIDSQIAILWPAEEMDVRLLNQTGISKDKRLQNLATRYLRDPASFVAPRLNIKPWKFALIPESPPQPV